MPQQTIGNMNGWWGMLFKLQLALVPFFIGWAVWVTSSIYQLQPLTPRYSFSDATREHAEMMREIDARFDALPPSDWRARITRIEEVQRDINANQVRILTQLERILKLP